MIVNYASHIIDIFRSIGDLLKLETKQSLIDLERAV